MAGALSAALRAGRSREALEGLYKHLTPAVMKFNDVIAVKGEGTWVWTADGRKLLDFTSGIGVVSTGHCHPRVVEAVRAQAGRIVHPQANVFGGSEPMVQLVDRLVDIMPGHLSRYFFCNSGAEGVENAIKVARAATGRQNIISFFNGYHGRTNATMALTTSKTVYRVGFGPFMPGVHIAPYPACLHCKVQEAKGHSGYSCRPEVPGFAPPSSGARWCCDAPLAALEDMLYQETAPRDTAAIIIEPILGEGGFLVPPPHFLGALRKLCDKHGMLLVFDEVQSGVGRTGRWWGHQHFEGAAPDIMVFAKGIASGYPFAGLAVREGLFDNCAPGTLGGTYGGNAVACAAAAATIDAIREDKMLENASERGLQLMKGLASLADRFPAIIDIRGKGLMVGMELKGDKGVASALTKATAKRDVLLMTAGAKESVRFLPPLSVTAAEVDIALGAVEAALGEVAK